MKTRKTDKNVLTVLSILSVLLLFSGVCALSLFGLYRMGVITLPKTQDEEVSLGTQDGLSFPVYTLAEENVYIPPSLDQSMEKLFWEAPFRDSYYIKVEVSTTAEADPTLPDAGTYEIWRYGDRFKINYYDFFDSVVQSVTCDGERIQVMNYRDASTVYYMLSADYGYDTFSPIPDFSDLSNQVYRTRTYVEKDGICTIIYEYDEGEIREKVSVDMTTGVITGFIRSYQGRIQMHVTLTGSDFSFVFQDYMFYLN